MGGFDLTTHKRNTKGKIVAENHYRLHVKGRIWEFERPPGSGNMYSLSGDLMRGPLLDEQKQAKLKAKAEAEVLEKLTAGVKAELEAKAAKEAKKAEEAAAEKKAAEETEEAAQKAKVQEEWEKKHVVQEKTEVKAEVKKDW